MSLSKYVQKILSGHPVNVSAFRKALPVDIRENFYSYFDVEPYTAKLSYVHCKDASSKDSLERLLNKANNRVEASFKYGDSHRKGVSIAYLLMYREAMESFSPDVVVITGDGGEQTKAETKRQVLIIENEENFFRHKEMLFFASRCLDETLSLGNTDVIFSAGNRINKDVTLKWISTNYERVFCSFDYDFGGLKIFKSLLSVVKNSTFLTPNNLQNKHVFFNKRPRLSNDLDSAKNLALELKLIDLAEAFHETRRFMEQESILTKEFRNDDEL